MHHHDKTFNVISEKLGEKLAKCILKFETNYSGMHSTHLNNSICKRKIFTEGR